MNIAVLGSNCKFSSDLAATLNKLKQSSLVYRYDVLSDFKKTVPLYSSLTTKSKGKGPHVDVDFEEEMPKGSVTTPLGEYIGDVETKFVGIPKDEKGTDVVKALSAMFDALNIKVNGSDTYGERCVIKKLRESNRNSEIFSSNLLNNINVFSGIVDDSMLETLLRNYPLMVVVRVKSEGFIPCKITKEKLSSIREKNPLITVLEVSSLDELLKNNFFISTFNLKDEKVKVTIEEKKEAKVVEMIPQPVEIPNVQRHGIIMNEMLHQALDDYAEHMLREAA